MEFDAWILCKGSVWRATRPRNKRLRKLKRSAVTGYWNNRNGRRVYNLTATRPQITKLVEDLEAQEVDSVGKIYLWFFHDDPEYLSTVPDIPNGVLALMKDHIIRDENGDAIGSTPATLENPNWAHSSFGLVGSRELIELITAEKNQADIKTNPRKKRP